MERHAAGGESPFKGVCHAAVIKCMVDLRSVTVLYFMYIFRALSQTVIML